MARIQYPNSSPYAVTPQLDWRLGRYAHRPIPADVADTVVQITAKYHNRPDRLSNDLYGTPNFYWVFMCRNLNQIRDPIFDLTLGMYIYAPSIAHLQGVLGQ